MSAMPLFVHPSHAEGDDSYARCIRSMVKAGTARLTEPVKLSESFSSLVTSVIGQLPDDAANRSMSGDDTRTKQRGK